MYNNYVSQMTLRMKTVVLFFLVKSLRSIRDLIILQFSIESSIKLFTCIVKSLVSAINPGDIFKYNYCATRCPRKV